MMIDYYLGDASSVETSFRETESGAETSSTSTDDESIEFVVNDFIRVGNLETFIREGKGMNEL